MLSQYEMAAIVAQRQSEMRAEISAMRLVANLKANIATPFSAPRATGTVTLQPAVR